MTCINISQYELKILFCITPKILWHSFELSGFSTLLMPSSLYNMKLKDYGLPPMWSETLAHGVYAKIHVSTYAAGGQLTPNP